LSKDEARRRYVEQAELAVLEQLREDAGRLDSDELAVGPFARLDANALAAREGKTRGAITNLFGSQAALQTATMALALDAAEELGSGTHPAPADHADPEDWVDAFFADQAAAGPATPPTLRWTTPPSGRSGSPPCPTGSGASGCRGRASPSTGAGSPSSRRS
jgi:hypothetical protein